MARLGYLRSPFLLGLIALGCTPESVSSVASVGPRFRMQAGADTTPLTVDLQGPQNLIIGIDTPGYYLFTANVSGGTGP